MVRSVSASSSPRADGRPPESGRPAIPRPAATVIVLRDGPRQALETFLVRRDPRSSFAADAFVFPGGTVHQDDLAGPAVEGGLTADEAHRRLTERGGDPPESPAHSLALFRAAVRELFEEAGILVAREAPSGTPCLLDEARRARLTEARAEIQAGRSTLADVAAALGLALDPEPLVYFSHWITPEPSPKRFDTRFFVVEQPPSQEASHCGVETVDGVWTTPHEALRRFEAGEITLVSVTVDHLRVLGRYGDVAEALAFARAKPIRTVCPRRWGGGWNLGADDEPW